MSCFSTSSSFRPAAGSAILLKPPELAVRAGRLNGACQTKRHVLHVERLRDISRRPRLDGLHDTFHVGMGRQHDDRHVGFVLAELPEDGEAVSVGKLVIGDGRQSPGRRTRAPGHGLGLNRFHPVSFQAFTEGPPHEALVVENQDPAGTHGA